MGCDRVCFVLPSAYGYFNPDIEAVGGGARQLSMLSRQLASDYDVHFVVEDCGQPIREVRDGVTLHRSYAPDPNTPAWRRPIHLTKLYRAMQSAGADVYVYRGRPRLAAATYVLARLLRSRWLYNLANDSNVTLEPGRLSAPTRQLFERALEGGEGVITQTDSQAALVNDRYGVGSTTIPSGYPLAETIRSHDEREGFLWVGRLDPEQKRPHLYLDLAAAMPDERFRLIGPAGHDESYARQIQARATDRSNVEYLGHVDPDDVHEYHRRATALVNTSAYEGFPSTFVEAWRVDTPVLSLELPASRYTDLPDDQGCAEGDFDRLVELAKSVAADPEERRTLSAPTHAYFEEHLTISRVAEQYAAVLDRACE